jgi:hypothetical protein
VYTCSAEHGAEVVNLDKHGAVMRVSLRTEEGGLGVKVAVGPDTGCQSLEALAEIARSRFNLTGPLLFVVTNLKPTP